MQLCVYVYALAFARESNVVCSFMFDNLVAIFMHPAMAVPQRTSLSWIINRSMVVFLLNRDQRQDSTFVCDASACWCATPENKLSGKENANFSRDFYGLRRFFIPFVVFALTQAICGDYCSSFSSFSILIVLAPSNREIFLLLVPPYFSHLIRISLSDTMIHLNGIAIPVNVWQYTRYWMQCGTETE